MNCLLAQTQEIVDGITKSVDGRSDVTYILAVLVIGLFGVVIFWLWKVAIPDRNLKEQESVERTQIFHKQAEGLQKIGEALKSVEANGRACLRNTEVLVALEGPKIRMLEKIDQSIDAVDLTPEISESKAIERLNQNRILRGEHAAK